MTYGYYCDDCKVEKEISAKRPKSYIKCECGKRMRRLFTSHFILKGEWPGKSIARENEKTGGEE